jgi:hypothetical protein
MKLLPSFVPLRTLLEEMSKNVKSSTQHMNIIWQQIYKDGGQRLPVVNLYGKIAVVRSLATG